MTYMDAQSRTIYFVSSTRGDRDFKLYYGMLIRHIKKYGTVLTEHIGYSALTSYGELNISDEEIFRRDIKLLSEADVAIGDISIPSLSVGYEIREIEAQKKRHLLLYYVPDGKRLSAMILGNKSLNVKNYKTIEDAIEYIDAFFTELKWTKLKSK